MIRLKELREKKGLTQNELSKLAGVSQSIVSDIENGYVSPTVRVLQKLTKALGVSISELLGEDDQPTTREVV